MLIFASGLLLNPVTVTRVCLVLGIRLPFHLIMLLAAAGEGALLSVAHVIRLGSLR